MTSETASNKLEDLLEELSTTEPGWKNFYKRLEIVNALERLGDPRAIPALEEIVVNDTQQFDAWGLDVAISLAEFAQNAIKRIRIVSGTHRQVVEKLPCHPPENLSPEETSTYQKFTRLYFMWRHEGIEPLGAIKVWSKSLLDDHFDTLMDRQREVVEMIYRCCVMATDNWEYPGDYLMLYSEHEIDLEVVSLEEIVKNVQEKLQTDWSIDIEVELPDELPAIKGNWGIGTAIQYLIIGGRKFTKRAFAPKIRAKLGQARTVQVQIETGIPQQHETRVIAEFSEAGARLNVAKFMLHQHGSQVEVSNSDQSIQFHFTLPLWFDEAKTKI